MTWKYKSDTVEQHTGDKYSQIHSSSKLPLDPLHEAPANLSRLNSEQMNKAPAEAEV